MVQVPYDWENHLIHFVNTETNVIYRTIFKQKEMAWAFYNEICAGDIEVDQVVNFDGLIKQPYNKGETVVSGYIVLTRLPEFQNDSNKRRQFTIYYRNATDADHTVETAIAIAGVRDNFNGKFDILDEHGYLYTNCSIKKVIIKSGEPTYQLCFDEVELK